jgi:hypothetical protein
LEALVIFLVFLTLMFLGVPIGTSLGIAAVITVYILIWALACWG